MAKDIPAVSDLRRKGIVTDAEISAATDAYIVDPKAGRFAFKSGHSIDVAEAIEQHPQANKELAAPGIAEKPKYRRTMVQTAVLMGFPREP